MTSTTISPSLQSWLEPLTLMTCGMLVLSTLLDEVSTCTNRWEEYSMHYGQGRCTGNGVSK